MSDRKTLAGLNALTGLLSFALPEREPHGALYRQTLTVLDMMDGEFWPLAYLRWELSLLDELGFGLDLTRCALTGSDRELTYISPKSGRAVASGAAGEWVDRLLPLSPALTGQSAETQDIRDGLRVTGHFLQSRLAPALGTRPLPQARQRLVDLLSR
jgi:DNA repair protein RecO (recombination protein O)